MSVSDLQKQHEAWERVKNARDRRRPNSDDFIKILLDSFQELHGDRLSGDDSAITAGIGKIHEISVTVIGIKKGKSMEENIECHFGMPLPSGYRKALRHMKLAEKFNRPVLMLVDTSGAYPGLEAETQSQGEAIAKNLFELAELKVPTLSIITGEGGSGGALALALADEVWMFENAIYSILSPEGFATILWKDASRAKEAAAKVKLTAPELLDLGIADRIILEPPHGIHTHFSKFSEKLKNEIYTYFIAKKSIEINLLLEDRYKRFRKYGVFSEGEL